MDREAVRFESWKKAMGVDGITDEKKYVFKN